MLRPIGTIFSITFPPSEQSTDRMFTTITYKVVAHIKATRFLGDEEGHMVEEIEPISSEQTPASLVYECKDGVWKANWEEE